jgi:hypothetical protein
MLMRAARTLAVLATIAVPSACQTVSDPLPPQGALNFDITDSAVSSQRAPLPAPQVVSWNVDEMSASNIPNVSGAYSFLFSGPCAYQLNATLPVSFSNACRTSGVTVSPGTVVSSATLHLKISRLEVRAAARPDLAPDADPDGDGVPNSSDNCPIIYNPDQQNSDAGVEPFVAGDACSDLDVNNNPTIPDQDQDGVRDSSDNCLWYPSPLVPGGSTPPDANHNGIGDDCERVAPVVLPGGSLTIECDNVSFSTQGSRISFFRMDFGRTGVLTCDAGFTGCTIDPSALKVNLSGTTTTFDCHQVP